MYPRRVLITGAAKRIGRCLAQAFAQHGCAVVIHYNTSADDAKTLLQELPVPAVGSHSIIQADLTDIAALPRFMALVMQDGPIDCLINNASTYHRGALRVASPECLETDYTINFRAPFELMRLFRQSCDSGSIINLLDYRVAMPDPDSGTYALAKKALKDATEAAAIEWAPEFRVNAIAPGIVIPPPGVPEERMQRLIARIPVKRRTTEQDIADAALFLSSTPSANGLILYLDGGLRLLGATATGEIRR